MDDEKFDENEVCPCCGKTAAEHAAEDAQAMHTHGWMTHAVLDGPFPNYHTHGFRQHFKQADVQIVAKIPPHLAHALIWNVADLLTAGTTIKNGYISNEILDGYPVKFIASKECGRKVWRLILADAQGEVDQDKIAQKYRFQYEVKT